MAATVTKADFRSDTVTRPTPAMLEAMMNAPVGDDVYGDDPSVNEFEAYIAELTGKEAALFVATGVMGNQICIRCAVESSPHPYKEVLVDYRGHVYDNELGGISNLSRAQVRPIEVRAPNQHLTADIIKPYLHLAPDHHHATSAVISLENTIYGHVMPLEDIVDIAALARTHNMWMHLDGARAWNAAKALNLSMKDLLEPFDSASLCMSKGMGAPIGSVIVGTKAMVDRARWHRKALGGGWRQAGLLAAACMYAAKNHFDRLLVDHDNAAFLASELVSLGFEMTMPVETNILFVNSKGFGHCLGSIKVFLEKHDIVITGATGAYGGRIVVHLQTTRQDIEKLVALLKELKATTTA